MVVGNSNTGLPNHQTALRFCLLAMRDIIVYPDELQTISKILK